MTDLRPCASVVVPAHDEAAVISDVLRTLVEEAEPGEFDVVVVCNGCTDDTAGVAAGFPGVRVVEIAQSSKIAALNAGDLASTTFPRIYVDADVAVGLSSVRAVVDVLEAGALAAAPLPRIDTAGCGRGARLYFALRSQIGYLRHHLLGAGFYALSESGRARFGEFPDVVADDGYVYSLFGRHERVNPPGASFTIRAPRTLASVFRRQLRIELGNLQLAALGLHPDTPGPGWREVVRSRPRLVPAALVYVAVNGAARVRARRLHDSGAVVAWSRDETSRTALTLVQGDRR